MSKYSMALQGNEHAVLLFHGLAATPLEVRYLAQGLNRQGFSIFAPTLPKYGFHTDNDCGTWEEWIDIAHTEFAALATKYDTVCVGGLSMGATLALALATKERAISSLALLSVTIDYDGWVIPWYQFLLKFAYYTPLRNIYRFHESEPYGLKNVQLRKRVAQAMATAAVSDIGPSSFSMEQLYQARQLGNYVKKSVNNITCDTLVVHAIDDDTSSPKTADYVFSTVNAAHKRKIFLDNSYHIITLDNDRELVTRETAAFFQESIIRQNATGTTQGPQIVNAEIERARRITQMGG
jgi:carboxylesterase